MIIKNPTGLYSTILPDEPSDSTSVIYTVSNQLPPRSMLNYLVIPDGVRLKERSAKTYSVFQRVEKLGDLVLTYKRGYNKSANYDIGLYKIGQIIDFSDSQNTIQDDDNTNKIVINHGYHYLDPSILNIPQDVLDSVKEIILQAESELIDLINSLQNDKSSLLKNINDTKKSIQEISRAISGYEKVMEIKSDQRIIDIIVYLENNLQVNNSNLETYLSQYDSLVAEIENANNKLNKLSEVLQ